MMMKVLYSCICYFWVTLHVLEVTGAPLDRKQLPLPPGDRPSLFSANGFETSFKQHDLDQYFLQPPKTSSGLMAE